MPDFIIADHGSIVTLVPMTPAAKAWVEEYLPDVQWLGRIACVDRRDWPDIYQGITEEHGLTVA